MTEKKDEKTEGAPCPPVEDRGDDADMPNEAEADYEAEEKDEDQA
jgi:hypothetical protein